jgi:fructokinase
MNADILIGVDLGGTKTEIACLSRDGEWLLRRRMPTPRGDYAATLAAIARLVAGAEAELGRRGSVGVGIPGSVSPVSGRIRNANSTWLNGRFLVQDLERVLGRPVRIRNDANCLAVSEATDGAGTGARVVFAAILGTGVGAGLVVDGRALVGPNGIAGEWGHNPLPAPRADELPGPACWCGRRGCIEAWVSGPALAADHANRAHAGAGQDAGGVPDHPRRTGADARAVVEAAQAGDPGAAASIERWIDRLGRALGAVINLLDPDVIVLGGGLSNVAALYERLPAAWAPHVFSDVVTTRLARSVHGDSSGVRGAAWLWRD